MGQIANQISKRTPKTLQSDGVRNLIYLKVVLCVLGRYAKRTTYEYPIYRVVTQMPAYAKFLKEILSGKKKMEETSVVKLNAHYSSILQNTLPQKCGDPCSFTIPCAIGKVIFEKSLCGSWASINLMPLLILKKLEGELGIINSIPVIIEDVLVRVDKFVFPVDFIVVDMEENKEVLLILRRPFMAIGKAILNVYEDQLMLRVGEEKVVFNMKKMMKFTQDEENVYSSFKVDILTNLAEEYKNENLIEEFRRDTYENARIFKEKTKVWHDCLIKTKEFKEGDKVATLQY
ncbi:hypothetical protein R3W88_033351 [Solanum pinnatisectum]|uniref:Reverse transcriptase n=1 Tax=Solanum pinnatisectum TaxID=50273 RepID=A0AAV9K1K0_9SOLN|nr:hypothetical protein R3W88_033351 [Solanum pinnatisectum]